VLSFADRIIRIEDGLIAKQRPESEVSIELLAPTATPASAIQIAQ